MLLKLHLFNEQKYSIKAKCLELHVISLKIDNSEETYF